MAAGRPPSHWLSAALGAPSWLPQGQGCSIGAEPASGRAIAAPCGPPHCGKTVGDRGWLRHTPGLETCTISHRAAVWAPGWWDLLAVGGLPLLPLSQALLKLFHFGRGWGGWSVCGWWGGIRWALSQALLSGEPRWHCPPLGPRVWSPRGPGDEHSPRTRSS